MWQYFWNLIWITFTVQKETKQTKDGGAHGEVGEICIRHLLVCFRTLQHLKLLLPALRVTHTKNTGLSYTCKNSGYVKLHKDSDRHIFIYMQINQHTALCSPFQYFLPEQTSGETAFSCVYIYVKVGQDMIGALKVMKNKSFMLSFQIPNMLIDSLTNFFAYECDILSFLIIQSLTLIFMEKNKTFKRKMTFISSKKNKKLYSFLVFRERGKTYFFVVIFREKKKHIFLFSNFSRRECSHI